MEAKFNEEKDKYVIDGLYLPRLTNILTDVFPMEIDPYYLEQAAIRGRIVHSMTEAFDKGDFTNEVITDDHGFLNYLSAWIKFKTDYDITTDKIKLIEKPHGSRKYMFGCRADRVLVWKDSLTIVDIKSGMFKKADILQTAGQMIAFNEGKKPSEKVKKRLLVYLYADGEYFVRECTSKMDKGIFLATLTVYNYKRQK